MTREIATHAVNPANRAIKIHVADEPGAGGASTCYMLAGYDIGGHPAYDAFTAADRALGDWQLPLFFQTGPVGPNGEGVNGITHEALLAVLIDRLEGFQRGPFACAENAEALMHLRMATTYLGNRTNRRADAGIEGTHAPD